MKLLNEFEMSQWAYFQCLHGNDTPEIRKLITVSVWAAEYYFIINKNLEIKKRISHYDWISWSRLSIFEKESQNEIIE